MAADGVRAPAAGRATVRAVQQASFLGAWFPHPREPVVLLVVLVRVLSWKVTASAGIPSR